MTERAPPGSVLDDEDIVATDEVLEAGEVVDTANLLAQTASKRAPAKGRPNTQTLLVFCERNVRESHVKLLVKNHYPGATARGVNTLDEFVALIGGFEKITRLIVFTHGAPGTIDLDQFYRIDGQEVRDAFAGRRPTYVGHIYFEGCNVGADPAAMYTFGDLIRAAKVQGMSWWHYIKRDTLTIGEKATTAKAIRESVPDLARVEKFIVERGVTDPLAHYAKKIATHEVMIEWFRSTKNDSDAPEPTDESRRRKDGKAYSITTVAGRDSAMSTLGVEQGKQPFWHVAVDVAKLRKDIARKKT